MHFIQHFLVKPRELQTVSFPLGDNLARFLSPIVISLLTGNTPEYVSFIFNAFKMFFNRDRYTESKTQGGGEYWKITGFCLDDLLLAFEFPERNTEADFIVCLFLFLIVFYFRLCTIVLALIS